MLRSKKEKTMNWYKQQSIKNLKEADLVLKTLATLDPFLNLIEDIESTKLIANRGSTTKVLANPEKYV